MALFTKLLQEQITYAIWSAGRTCAWVTGDKWFLRRGVDIIPCVSCYRKIDGSTRERERLRSSRRRRAAGAVPRGEWLAAGAARKRYARDAWRAGVSKRRTAWMLGVHPRTADRYLVGMRETRRQRAKRLAARRWEIEQIERPTADRAAGKRRPGRWSAEHELRRQVAVRVLIDVPFCTVEAVASALGVCRQTVHAWLDDDWSGRWHEALQERRQADRKMLRDARANVKDQRVIVRVEHDLDRLSKEADRHQAADPVHSEPLPARATPLPSPERLIENAITLLRLVENRRNDAPQVVADIVDELLSA